MPPSLSTATPPAPAVGTMSRTGWLLPAGLLFSMLLLSRCSQAPPSTARAGKATQLSSLSSRSQPSLPPVSASAP